jgi:hypothetical protein
MVDVIAEGRCNAAELVTGGIAGVFAIPRT